MKKLHAGLTLLELMFVIAVAAILMSLAVPTYADFSARHRLVAANEALQLQMREARYEAVQRATPLYVNPSAGAQWCVVLATTPECSCGSTSGCALKTIEAREFQGVTMALGQSVRFDPVHGHASPGTVAVLTAGRRYGTELQITPLGRPKACAKGAAISGYPAC